MIATAKLHIKFMYYELIESNRRISLQGGEWQAEGAGWAAGLAK